MVQLITNSRNAVGAKIVRTLAHGVVQGAGGAILKLDYVTSLADVKGGDIVVTSGDDGIYPAGFEIGRVLRVTEGAPVPGLPQLPVVRAETALFLNIDVDSLTDVLQIEQVLLLSPQMDRECPRSSRCLCCWASVFCRYFCLRSGRDSGGSTGY